MKKFMFFLLLPLIALNAQNVKTNIIKLKNIDNEADYKIEVIFAKELAVDCNNHFLEGGKLDEKPSDESARIYEFDAKGELVSTMMLCSDNKKRKKFVNYSFTQTFDYDSYTPIVIKTPKEIAVKYKIYKKIGEKDAEVGK